MPHVSAAVKYKKNYFKIKVIPKKFHLGKRSVTLTGFIYTTDQPWDIKNETEMVSTCLNQ